MSEIKPTLLVLAAGMGSRYGGLKQIDGFGPSGETIMDYSIYDALAAGFGKVVFVIRRDFEAAFRSAVGGKYERRLAVEYVFQQLDDVPSGFTVPAGRTKPWGTAHAIWCARQAISEPFASINADDYYGRSAFKTIAGHLTAATTGAGGLPEYSMVGYPILQTLSEHAPVARGVCKVDAAGMLEAIDERMKVESVGSGGVRYMDAAGQPHPLRGDEVVSMNFWGFTPAVFPQIEQHLVRFFESQAQGTGTAECLIPVVVGEIIKAKAAKLRVLSSTDPWFGVTHPEDKPGVMQAFRDMVTRGQYPSPIWNAG